MTKFIAHDDNATAIMAIGDSADEAITNAIYEAGPLFDADGDQLTDDAAREKFIALPATPALIAQVEADGGMTGWGEIDGVACTETEYEATL